MDDSGFPLLQDHRQSYDRESTVTHYGKRLISSSVNLFSD